MAERHRALYGGWHTVCLIFSAIGLFLGIIYIFNLKPFGVTILDNSYYYLLIAIFVSMVFIIYPAAKARNKAKIPWYDIVLSALCIVSSIYLAWHGKQSCLEGWTFAAPLPATVFSVILWGLLIESVRRAGGTIIALICLFFSFYPLFAPYMPGFLEGTGFSFLTTASYHILSSCAVLGIPTQVFAKLLIGFIIFGVALQITGGGEFFINLANALFGHTRGGPAKVSVVASAFFGSISGSAISNVATTGAITIPTMKRTGYPPHYAAAIEACASTGGVLMPPIMGATAFIMASFLNLPYIYICVAAALPSLLYYFGLFLQTDFYAAKTGLKGLNRSDLPSFKQTLKEGWFYILAFAVLVYLLTYERIEAMAPFYAIALLFILSTFRKKTRLNLKKFIDFIAGSGRLLTELFAILVAIGFILGAVSMTGVGNSLSREIVHAAGGSLLLLLVLGAFASFILGMGMTITACYVFLVVVLVPALVQTGLDPLAVHLFIMYWGMISYITPPVALAAYTAATISGSKPMKTGFQAMRLGIAIYFLPFFFVLNPALILHGSPVDIIHSFFTCALGIALLAGAMEGYLPILGAVGKALRPFIAVSGVLLGIPEWQTDAAGALILALVLVIHFVQRRSLKLNTGT